MSTQMEVGRLLVTVADLVYQFAYRTNDGWLHDGGLSSLEVAFDVLIDAGVMRQVQPDREWYEIDWPVLAALATPTPADPEAPNAD